MNKTGVCYRCGAFSETASRVKVVVSDKFTGWDDYTQDWDPLWCKACAWGHTATEVRTRGWRIGGSHTIEAGGSILFDELSQPLPVHVAVTVPLSRHKHILPSARWGSVTTDDRCLMWAHTEVRRLNAVEWLMGHGFHETALVEAAPRFDQFRNLNGGQMQLALRKWEELSEWRKDSAYMKVACFAIRKARKVQTND